MKPKVERSADGSVTISLTLPAGSSEQSLLNAEEELVDALNAVGRESMGHLLSRYDLDGAPLMIGGKKWTSKGLVSKIYETPWGEVILARHLYQSSAGGATLCPLEETARIIAGSATPHLARSLAHKYANADARAVVRDLLENHGRKLCASYVADVANAVAAAAGAPVIEQNAHAPQSPGEEVKSIVLGLDGTCALFCEEGFKQCMVGTIGLYNETGVRLETIYLGQAPEAGKAAFLNRLDDEWQRVIKIYPKARRVALSDGARDYEPWLAERTTWQILDFYHASGYVAGAAPGMHRPKAKRAEWLEAACHALKHEPGAAARLAREFAAQSKTGARLHSAGPALEAAKGYFAHNLERMKYSVFAAMNFPIGSGVTEAACKTLIKTRLCRSGMRWTRAGAQTVITLRAMLLSESRWTSLWKYIDHHGLPLI